MNEVLIYAASVRVEKSQVELGRCMALVGGVAIPSCGLNITLRYAVPHVIGETK